MILLKQGRQILQNKHFPAWFLLADQSKRDIIGGRQATIVEDGTADPQSGSREVIECERDERALWPDGKRSSVYETSALPLIISRNRRPRTSKAHEMCLHPVL